MPSKNLRALEYTYRYAQENALVCSRLYYAKIKLIRLFSVKVMFSLRKDNHTRAQVSISLQELVTLI